MNPKQKTDQARLQSLVRISRYEAQSLQDLLYYAINETITLTRSKIGCIFLYSEETKKFTLNVWSKNAGIADQTATSQEACDLDQAGFWGEAVRQSRPIVVNDAAASDDAKKGCPNLSFRLNRFMSLPVFSQGKIVAVLALANKTSAYTEKDIHQVALMMDSIWPIARQREIHDACLQSRQPLQPEAELERYRNFIVNIADACFEFDLHGRAIFCNEATIRMLGYTEEEYLNLRHHERYATQEKADRIYGIFNNLYRTGLPVTVFESDLLCKDGSEINMEMSVSLIRDKDGTVTGFRGVGRDITARKKAQGDLERYRNFIENIGDGCFEIDMNGIVTYVNEVIEKRMGYSRGELIGASSLVYAGENEATRLFDIFKQIYLTGEPSTIEDFMVRDKDGATRYISMTVSVICDEADNRIGFRGTTRDVTDKKLTQAALEQSETRYRNIFQYNKAVMLLVDPENGAIVDANLAACSYYQYSHDQLLGMNVTDIRAQTQEEIAEEMERAGIEERNHYYFKHRLATGEIRPVEVFSGPIEIGGKELLYSIVHDITERRKAEEALRASEEKYRSIMESIMEGYLEYDLTGNIIFANDAACTMMGYPREELLSMNYSRIASSHTSRIIDRSIRDIVATGAPRRLVDFEIIRRDGTRRIHQHNLSLIRDAEGKPAGIRAMGRDITELKWAEEALRQSEERIRLLFRNIPVPTFVWKAQHDQCVLSEFNNAAFQFIGDKVIDMLGKPVQQLFVNMPQIAADITKCMDLKRHIENQFWYTFDDHSEKRYVIVKYAFAPPDSVLMHVNDITGQKRAEENLQFISIHDSLTGLFNRFYSDAEISRLAASRLRPVSVIVIDLNNLKKINDESGHAMGDLYIKNAASLLRQTFRPEDMIARIGGDEFLVFLPLVDENICAQAMERLNESIRQFNQKSEFPLSLSAGFATVQAGDNLVERIREADQRMYEDKAAYKAARNQPFPY